MTNLIGIIGSKLDVASANMARCMLEQADFEERKLGQQTVFRRGNAVLLELDQSLVEADIDKFGFEVAYFISKHKSADQVSSLTVHSLGNFTDNAKLGGRPKELSHAAPLQMLGALNLVSKIGLDIQKTYEATHHGPLLKTPCFFVEMGGNDKTIEDKKVAQFMAARVLEAIELEVEYAKIVFGIGSTHYPAKFTKLALEKGYAFSHIMPKYALYNQDGTNNLDMLEQMLKRSKNAPELAVIDWKSINADAKNIVLNELARLGVDYEKV